MNAVDTNILIYVNDPRDPQKQAIAGSLISSLTEGVLIFLMIVHSSVGGGES